MNEKKYINRIIDKEIKVYLETFGAILIRGPKWCGKTTTAEQFAKSVIKMQDSLKSKEYIAAADTDISLILRGDNPRLIDEWQVYPNIWNAVRNDVDVKNKEGLYILTGSRVPKDDEYRHSGAGRIGALFMYPMSLAESGDSNSSISLEKLFKKEENINGKKSKLTVDDLAYCLCRGGWPANFGLDYQKCALRIKSYLDLIYESDDLELKKYAKDVEVAKNIIKSYSRNISTLTDLKTIYKDTTKNDISISESQFYDYINALKNNYLIEDVAAWSPNIRSKTAIRTTPKKELIDPSIAALYLGITPDNYVENYKTFGFLFESLCIRDLRVYASSLGGKVYYYHDRNGLEVDAVIVLDDGRYGLVEIKLASKEIEEASIRFEEFERVLDSVNYKKPSFKMVLTAGELAYTKENGTLIIPIGCLTK